MLVLLRRQWKLFPVTMILITICVVIYACTRAYYHWTWSSWYLLSLPKHFSDNFGFCEDIVPVSRKLQRFYKGVRAQAAMEQFGAVGLPEVWDGQVWRLLASAFHHDGFFLHLSGNLLGIYAFGSMIEPRFPRWWYIVFCLSSAFLTVVVEALHAQPAVGISGTACAMFGLLAVLRVRDPEIARRLPKPAILIGILSLVICIPITMLGWLPIANGAHFAGLGYGALAGWAMIAKRVVLTRRLFLAGHLLLIPLCLLAMKPSWTDAYIGQRLSQSEDNDEQRRLVKILFDRQPDHPSVRASFVAALLKDSEFDEAWRVALEGWNGGEDRGQSRLTSQLKVLWANQPDAAGRERAEAVMDDLYGAEADRVKDELELDWLTYLAVKFRRETGRRPTVDDVVTGDFGSSSEAKPDWVDDPASAALGRQL